MADGIRTVTAAEVAALATAPLEKGVTVEERTVKAAELDAADEIFSTGNYAKVLPCTRYNGRDMQIGRFATQARDLYFDWMKTTAKIV